MFLIGIIAFKVTERFALQGKIDSVKSIVTALENSYLEKNDIDGGIGFLKKVLDPGAWGAVAIGDERLSFSTSEAAGKESRSDPLILEAGRAGHAVFDIEGVNIPPFSSYRGIKIAAPIRVSGKKDGALLIYQPLSSLGESIVLGQRLIALWIILFLIIIALFGFYILSRRIIRPVHELIRTAESIGAGKFPESADVGRVREINQLHSALRNMYDEIESGKKELRNKIKELEEANAELRSTQRELIEAEKLASLGQLSAGVAHEIGNPLSAINGYVDVMKRSSRTDEDKKTDFLNEIKREVDRVDRIIRTLLDYSRPKKLAPQTLSVNQVIRDTVDILNSQGVLKRISVRFQLEEDIPLIEADPNQLSQVIINLILNSRDAIADSGEITISTQSRPDSTVLINITDNGAGIAEEIRSKIFDPFFTTKEPGHGTGLGLSVSARIVETYGGKISVDSKEGQGSAFKIIFPRAKDYKNAENFGN